MNDLGKVIARLEQQRGAIDKALVALREIEAMNPAGVPPVKHALVRQTATPAVAAPKKKRRLSAAGRKKIIEAAKKYWAAKRAAQAAEAKKK